jgi:hypothetical protein
MKTSTLIVSILLIASIIFLNENFGRDNSKTASLATQAKTEVCEVVANNQSVRTPYGIVKVAIVKRGTGELRSIHLNMDATGRPAQPKVVIPDGAHYAYIAGLDNADGEPTSVVPIFDK